MQTIVAQTLVALSLAAPGTQSPAPYAPPPVPPQRIHLTSPVEVPMILHGDLPLVDVRIGERTYRFGVETGAGFVVITPALATDLALTPGGGTPDLPGYTIDRMQIGDAVFEGVAVSALPLAQPDVDGVLGLPFYADLLLTLDYPGRRVRFERGSLPDADGRTILPLSRVGPFWGVPATFAGTPVTAVVDTRSTGAFGVVPALAARLSFDGPLQVVGRARGAAIPETDVKAGRLAGDITLGAFTFPSPIVNVRSLPPGFPDEPILGTRVLRNFVVTLDQRHARIRLSRDGDTAIVLEPAGRTTRAAVAPSALTPVPSGLPDTAMRQYAGTYGGGVREVRIEGDALILQRQGGPPLAMVHAGDDTFTLAAIPEARLRFVRNESGAVVELLVLNPQGAWERAARDAGAREG